MVCFRRDLFIAAGRDQRTRPRNCAAYDSGLATDTRPSPLSGPAGIMLPPCRYGQPFVQFRPPPTSRHVAHGNCDSLLLADQDDEALPSGDASVEQVPL